MFCYSMIEPTVPRIQLLHQTVSNVLNKERLLKAVQYLSLIRNKSSFRQQLCDHYISDSTYIHKVFWNVPDAYISTICIGNHRISSAIWNLQVLVYSKSYGKIRVITYL